MSELMNWMQEVLAAAGGDAIARGFKRTGLALRRRHGSTKQEICFQRLRWSHADFGDFLVKVGVDFVGMKSFGHKHWQTQLEYLPGWDSTARHLIAPSTDRAALAARLRPGFSTALDLLDRIDSPASGVAALALAPNGRDDSLLMRLKYAAGDYAGAEADLLDLPLNCDLVAIAQTYEMTKLDLSRVNAEPDRVQARARREEFEQARAKGLARWSDQFVVGSRIVHSEFGRGVVTSIPRPGYDEIEARFGDEVRKVFCSLLSRYD